MSSESEEEKEWGKKKKAEVSFWLWSERKKKRQMQEKEGLSVPGQKKVMAVRRAAGKKKKNLRYGGERIPGIWEEDVGPFREDEKDGYGVASKKAAGSAGVAGKRCTMRKWQEKENLP